MIADAVVKEVTLGQDLSRLEVYSSKYQDGKPLAILPISLINSPVKFIEGWDDIIENTRPFKINGGEIPDDLIGNSTLVMGMQIQCKDDPAIYIVMSPVFIR